MLLYQVQRRDAGGSEQGRSSGGGQRWEILDTL